MSGLPWDGRRLALRWPGPQPGAAEGRLADAALVMFAVAVGGLAQAALWHSHGAVLDGIDLGAGVVSCLTLWWRRAAPVAVTLVVFAAAWFSPLAQGAALVAIATAAFRLRGARALALLALLAAAGSVLFPLVNPGAAEMLSIGFPAFLVVVIAFGWGLYARARRELLDSLTQRAQQAEAERERTAERARDAERRRIAREMHDVLAHRLSLLAVHAGALEIRPDAPPGDITRAAGVIRESAAAALSELRQVIAVLREDASTAAPPQPELAQLPALVAESRAAGMTLRDHLDLTGAGPLPAAAQRAAYRVVQEGLTNARKHAPGAAVEVTVTGSAQAGLVAEIVSRRRPAGAQSPAVCGDVLPSPAGVASPPAFGLAAPGPGTGLIGLAERLGLVGGRLEYGPDAAGDFVLRATIPGCT